MFKLLGAQRDWRRVETLRPRRALPVPLARYARGNAVQQDSTLLPLRAYATAQTAFKTEVGIGGASVVPPTRSRGNTTSHFQA
jgi:hypothetical protein